MGERELVGGECSYWACVPSKALLRPVIAVSDSRRIDGAREAVTGSLDTAAVFGRRDRYVSNWDDSRQADAYVTGIGADLVRGHGRLDGPRRVAVTAPDGDAVALTARQAVAICIGSAATRHTRYHGGQPVDQSQGHRQRRGARPARGHWRWRGRGRDGDRMARPRLVGRGLAEAGVDVHVGVPVTADGYTGRAQMVVDLDRGYLLGVMFVGPGVSEL